MAAIEDAVWEAPSPRESQDSAIVRVLHSPSRKKSWEFKCEASPKCISVLCEWGQSCSPPAHFAWEFGESDVADVARERQDQQCLVGVALHESNTMSVSHKNRLGELVQRVLRRPISAGEVVYSVERQTAPFLAVVSVTAAVRGENGVTALPFHFSGTEAPTKKDAEQSAAAVAFEGLQFLGPLEAAAPPVAASVKPSATSGSNFKGHLIELMHRLLRRPVAPGEITYSTDDTVPPFRVTVSVTAALQPHSAASESPLQFTGVEAADRKSAEQSAAMVAFEELQSFQPLEKAPDVLPAASQEGRLAPTLVASSAQPGNFKGQLNEALIRFLGRPVAAGEVVYSVLETDSVGPPFVATVNLTQALQGKSATTPTAYTGPPCSSKKESEQGAAEQALIGLRDIIQLCSSDTITANEPAESLSTTKTIVQFHCTLSVRWSDSLRVDVKTPTPFPSKQLAKEAAALMALIQLCKGPQPSPSLADFDTKAGKQTSTATRKLKAALAPCWHGELLERCPPAGLQCARLRVEKGWTQRQLADRLQPSQRVDVIRRLEADGEMPDGKIIDAINRALGTTLPRSKPQRQQIELDSPSVGNAKPIPAKLQEFIVESKADAKTAMDVPLPVFGN